MAIAFSHAGSGSVKVGTTASATVTINTGDTSVIAISILANTSPSSVIDSGGSVYKFRLGLNNGTTDRIEIWSTDSGAAIASTSVTVKFAASTTYVVSAATYTGVLGLGILTSNSATSTAPSTAISNFISTQDPNNWVVMGIASVGIGTFSATVPNVVRTSTATSGGSASTNEGGAIVDAGAFATPGANSVTAAISTSQIWAIIGLELRSVSLAYSYLCGFELNSVGEFNSTGGTVPTIQSATVHGGSFAMRCHPTAASSYIQLRQIQGIGNTHQAVFCSVRFYINIATLPNVNTDIYSGIGLSGTTSFAQTIILNTDGSVSIQDGAGVTATSSVKLSTGTWHQISFAVNPINGSNFISLTIDGSPQAQVTSTAGNTFVYDTAWVGVGVGASSTPTCDVYFDDILFSNDFAVIGPGQQVILLPTADSAIGNWTGGAGGVTNLFNAVKNIPPVGVAAGSETNTSQIKNANATVPNNYTATCQSYTAKGIAAGSTVNAVSSIVADSAETATFTAGFTFVASNPAQTAPSSVFEFEYGLGNVAAAFPSGWNVDLGLPTTTPTVVLGTAPTVTVQKVSAVTTVDDACFLGIYVDYNTPSAVAPVWNMPFLPGFGNGR